MLKSIFNKSNIVRALNVTLIIFLLFLVPLTIHIEQLVAYYFLVSFLTILMIREMKDPKKAQKAFLQKWHVKRNRSNHVNGLLFAGEVFLMMMIPALLIHWMMRGTQDFFLQLEILGSLWVLMLAISIGIGYLSISINERRYEETIVKLEKEGEELSFLEEDPEEKDGLINSQDIGKR